MARIPFAHLVHRDIEPLLIEQGFVLHHAEYEPSEGLTYRRTLTDGEIQQVTFHGGDFGDDFARLAVGAAATGKFIVLKQLLPNYASLKGWQAGHWIYREDELEAVIEEIKNLVKEKLFKWFDDPVANPASVQPVSKEKLAERVKDLYTNAQNADAAGNVELAAKLRDLAQKIEAVINKQAE